MEVVYGTAFKNENQIQVTQLVVSWGKIEKRTVACQT